MRYLSIRLIALVALLAGVTGCTTNKQSPRSAPGFVVVPCPPDKALVYLYRVRRWHPDGDGITMCVNGTPVVALHGRQYCPLILEPGMVSFSHEYGVGPYGVITTTMKDLDVQLQPGKTYFVAYRFWLNPFTHPKPEMDLVDEATGTNEMSICSMKNEMLSQTLKQPGGIYPLPPRW